MAATHGYAGCSRLEPDSKGHAEPRKALKTRSLCMELLDAASDAQTIVQAERLCEDLTRILATAQYPCSDRRQGRDAGK